ncbi:Protein of unknown function [Pyronema omphalodes CBS 100304]|uniref:Uncharacterized protein n=1 Tax=Pyronema omphalodes (strain CBS 100304) TaxID=1076935 RepID=U4LHM4_PYROM|nr:Protein of unknown function [Pyronema omphalodes CBS 100304]
MMYLAKYRASGQRRVQIHPIFMCF